MEKYFDEGKNIEIVAKEIRVGKDVSFGSNVRQYFARESNGSNFSFMNLFFL